jgi:hypothetical protein
MDFVGSFWASRHYLFFSDPCERGTPPPISGWMFISRTFPLIIMNHFLLSANNQSSPSLLLCIKHIDWTLSLPPLDNLQTLRLTLMTLPTRITRFYRHFFSIVVKINKPELILSKLKTFIKLFKGRKTLALFLRVAAYHL